MGTKETWLWITMHLTTFVRKTNTRIFAAFREMDFLDSLHVIDHITCRRNLHSIAEVNVKVI